ncbi:hypothetical protein [Herbiconiux sp. UC225_62]|uniref:hypothetical protein n=1 Tax=Herbiconiux sp. UC225_62 TaxID=3350168 RepID=UPI0036D28E59
MHRPREPSPAVYGKLGDLIGRQSLFIGAIALFLRLRERGMSQDMTWLIAGRAVPGLGGGGLSQAIIADVVPARERGTYMGVMGGVFALSSVAGPLGLLAVASTGLVLLTTRGGTIYDWNSPVILSLTLGRLVAEVLFVMVERRVPLVLVALVLLVFVKEKPLATTIERDILPETLEIDGATRAVL